MNSFIVALNAITPLIIITLLGYVIKKLKLITHDGFTEINKLLTHIIFPLLVFNNIYNANLEDSFSSPALIYTTVMLILVFFASSLAVRWVDPVNNRRSVMLQGMIRTSAVLFGIPLASSILPESSMGVVSLAATLTIPYNSIFPVFGFSMFSDKETGFRANLIRLIKNPILLGAVAGIVVKLIGIHIPTVILSPISMVGSIGTPLSFLAIGGTFTFNAIKKFDKSLWFTVMAKVLLIPAVVVGIAVLLGIRDEGLLAILIVFGGPTAVPSYPVAVAEGGDAELANNIVVYGMIACVFTLIGFITILGHFGFVTLY